MRACRELGTKNSGADAVDKELEVGFEGVWISSYGIIGVVRLLRFGVLGLGFLVLGLSFIL